MANPAIYKADTNYIMTYADKEGKSKEYKITPEEDLSIAKMITKCKSANKDYIKLLDIKEESKSMKKESKLLENNTRSLYDYLEEKNFEDIDIADATYDMMVAYCLDPDQGDTGSDYDQYIVKLAKQLEVVSAGSNVVVVNITRYVKDHFAKLEQIFDVPGESQEDEEEYLVCTVIPGIISGYVSDNVYKELNNMSIAKDESKLTEANEYNKYRNPDVKIETTVDLSGLVKEYFTMLYSDNPEEMDDMINDIKDDLTFQDVVDALNEGKDIYDVLGVGDSVVREEVFNALCDLTGLDYDVFYYKWLGEPDQNTLNMISKIKGKLGETKLPKENFRKIDYDPDTFDALVEIENRATFDDMKKIADKEFLEEITSEDEFWQFLVQESDEEIRRISAEYFPKEIKESLKEDEDLEELEPEDIPTYDAEDEIDNIWTAVCSGDNEYIKKAFEDGRIAKNTRYHRFDMDHSLIMGALRNNNFETVELLKSLGETILKDEVPEYKKIMAPKEYEDDVTRSALNESKLIEDDEPEDQTQTQLDVEEAVSEVENPSEEDKLAVNVANSSIDVLIADEESAIEGYNAFLNQAKETILPPLYEVLEKEINEIIKDEEDHINKLNVIKEGFHLDNIPVEESKSIKTEDNSNKYRVTSYYGKKMDSMEDSMNTGNWSDVEEYSHEKLMNGLYIKILNIENGNYQILDPDDYKDNNGEFPIKSNILESKSLTESVDLDNIRDKASELGYEVVDDERDEEGKTIIVYRKNSESNIDNFDDEDNSELYDYLSNIPNAKYQIDDEDCSSLAVWLRDLDESNHLNENDVKYTIWCTGGMLGDKTRNKLETTLFDSREEANEAGKAWKNSYGSNKGYYQPQFRVYKATKNDLERVNKAKELNENTVHVSRASLVDGKWVTTDEGDITVDSDFEDELGNMSIEEFVNAKVEAYNELADMTDPDMNIDELIEDIFQDYEQMNVNSSGDYSNQEEKDKIAELVRNELSKLTENKKLKKESKNIDDFYTGFNANEFNTYLDQNLKDNFSLGIPNNNEYRFEININDKETSDSYKSMTVAQLEYNKEKKEIKIIFYKKTPSNERINGWDDVRKVKEETFTDVDEAIQAINNYEYNFKD